MGEIEEKCKKVKISLASENSKSVSGIADTDSERMKPDPAEMLTKCVRMRYRFLFVHSCISKSVLFFHMILAQLNIHSLRMQ